MAVAGARVSQVVWSARLRVPALRGAQLLAASGFALAQPLFDLLGKNAEFFAVRGSTPGDIVLFALVVTFVPALVLLAVEVVVAAVSEPAALRAPPRLPRLPRRGLRRPGAKRSGVDGTDVLIAGAVADRARARARRLEAPAARSFLTVLAAAPIVFLALFLLDSPTSKLVISSGTAEAAAIRTRATTPIVFLLLDEFPVIDLQQADGGIDAKRFPNFARLAGELDLVPQHHDRLGLDHGRRARDPDRPEAEAGRAADLPRPPEQPLHPPRQPLPNGRARVADAAVPAAALQAEDGRHGLPAVVALLRRARRLPAPARAAGAGAAPARDRRVVGQLRQRLDRGGGPGRDRLEGLPKVDLNTFYLGRVRDFRRFVASFRKPGNGPPTLYFLHDLLPHTPWLYFPDGRARAVSSTNAPGRNGELWFNGQLATQAWQRHLLQVGYTDQLLGTFIARLHKVGLWDKALVIVTPDHGISFRGGDLRRRPTTRTWPSSASRRCSSSTRAVGGPGGRLAARDDARHPPDDRRRARDQDPVAHRRPLGAPGRRRLERGRRRRRAGAVPGRARAAPGLAGARAVALRQRRLGRAVLGHRPLPRARRQQRLDPRGRGGARPPPRTWTRSGAVSAALPARLGARALAAGRDAVRRAGRPAGRRRAQRAHRRGQRRLPQPGRRPGALLGPRRGDRLPPGATRCACSSSPDARRTRRSTPRRPRCRARRRARRARAARTAGSAGT